MGFRDAADIRRMLLPTADSTAGIAAVHHLSCERLVGATAYDLDSPSDPQRHIGGRARGRMTYDGP